MNKILLLLCACLIWMTYSFGQIHKVDSVLNVYNQNYQPEKVYIQFDKYVYKKDETIWFKAYLFTGTDLSDISKNFYVDFFDNTGKLLKHFVTPIYQASANGQFTIPANYSGSFIHVKAYTQWMLNFDSSFIYTKDIIVVQSKPNKTNTESQYPTSLQFFPEGGDLVEELNSKVAFLAVNKIGSPVDASGYIVSDKGAIIDSFKSQHDGMGFVSLNVKSNEKYFANWQDAKGNKYSTPLPEAKKTGINLSVQPVEKKAIVIINRTQNIEEASKVLYVVASMNQQLVFRSRVNLIDGLTGVSEIPTENFPTGILQITILNSQLIPVAERIMFINNHRHEFVTDVSVQEKNLGRKGKNIIEITVPDSVSANMSLSITDGDLRTDNNNIFSQTLLCDDIKGYVHNPSYYFESDADSIRQHLDLVMLTHGWRRFNWDKALNGIAPMFRYSKDSDYIQIKGKVDMPSNAKITTTPKIILILEAKDSSKQSVVIPIEKDGTFTLHGAIFFDTLHVYYSLDDKKVEKKSELNFKNGFIPAQVGNISSNYISPYLWSFNDSSQIQRVKYLANKQSELEELMKTTTLKGVTVEAKAKAKVDVLDEKYTSGMFSSGDALQYDVVNDSRSQGIFSVFDYLKGMVPGLQILQGGGDGWEISWRGHTPELFLDEIRSDITAVGVIPMADVAYIKVFRPPFFGAYGGGAGGAIAVYTRKGTDLVMAPNSGLNYKLLEGYSSIKQFYSPDYSVEENYPPDVRTTLYWKPYLLADAHNRKVKIEFYNNDVSQKMRLIIEGVNTDGKLTRTEKIIE